MADADAVGIDALGDAESGRSLADAESGRLRKIKAELPVYQFLCYIQLAKLPKMPFWYLAFSVLDGIHVVRG